MTPMRTFIALPLPQAAREHLVEVQQELARRVPRKAALRWTDPENLHLTLKFLGYVDPERVPELEALVEAAAAPFSPMDTTLGHVSAFASPRRARVVVAHFSHPAELLELAALVERLAGPLGFPPETRPFVAHITLARLRQPMDLASALEPFPPLELPIHLSELVLFESRLTPTRAFYRPITTRTLGSPPSHRDQSPPNTSERV